MSDEGVKWCMQILEGMAKGSEGLEALQDEIVHRQERFGVSEEQAIQSIYSDKRKSGEISDGEDLYGEDLYGLGGR